MTRGCFSKLIRWEINEYLSYPIVTFLIVSAVIAVLAQPQSSLAYQYGFRYVDLYFGSGTLFLFLTFSVSAIFSRSFAGSISRGETKLILSYPVKRSLVFLSKFVALFSIVFIVYASAFSLHLYINMLSPVEPMFLLTLFVLFLQVSFTCAVAISISLTVKNEVLSILASTLLLFGVDSMIGNQSYFSSGGRFNILFGYFAKMSHPQFPPFGDNYVVTTNEVVSAILMPLLIFLILFSLSFLYFTRLMEVD